MPLAHEWEGGPCCPLMPLMHWCPSSDVNHYLIARIICPIMSGEFVGMLLWLLIGQTCIVRCWMAASKTGNIWRHCDHLLWLTVLSLISLSNTAVPICSFCRAVLTRCWSLSLQRMLCFALSCLFKHQLPSLTTPSHLQGQVRPLQPISTPLESLQFCLSPPWSYSVITWLLTGCPTCLACQSWKIHGHYPETKGQISSHAGSHMFWCLW